MENTPNQLGLAVLTLLAWLSAADGPLSVIERERLRALARANDNGAQLREIVPLVEGGSVPDLQLAAEIVRRYLTVEQRELFLELAIGAALCDGYLSVAENHILRFLADLVGCSPWEFNRLFRGYAGRDLPNPGDPSSASWWRERAAGPAREARTGGGEVRPPSTAREKACAVLGVAYDASDEEVKKAYRRLAKQCHPDRFQQLGAGAVEEAKRQFQRIGEAYEVLQS